MLWFDATVSTLFFRSRDMSVADGTKSVSALKYGQHVEC